MREFRVFYGLFLVIAAIMCVCYSSRLMPILLAVMLLTLAASFLLSLIGCLMLSVNVEPFPEVVYRKSELALDVHIKNRFIMPLSPVMIYVRVAAENRYEPENRVIVVGAKPRGSVTLKIANVMSYRGEYEVGVEKIEFFDLLKLCKFKKTFKNKRVTVSVPRKIFLNRLGDDNEEEDENAIARPDGLNRNVFSHLREYREGDTLRHIHWKLSARLDELIVKQMEQNYNNSALIFCDFNGSYNSIEAALNSSDPCIEAALAIVRRIILSGNGARFIYQDVRTGKSEAVAVEDETSLEELERSLAKLPAEVYSAGGGSFAELLTEYENDIWVERAVYIITPNLTEELAEKIRALGLTARGNAAVAVINPDNAALTEYLECEAKIDVYRVENDDISVLGERKRR